MEHWLYGRPQTGRLYFSVQYLLASQGLGLLFLLFLIFIMEAFLQVITKYDVVLFLFQAIFNDNCNMLLN